MIILHSGYQRNARLLDLFSELNLYKPSILMKKFFIYLPFFFLSITTLQGQIEQQSTPREEEISNRRSSFNLDEIKVRWKKAALENCTGVPCIIAPPQPSFTCGTSTITDVDGKTYTTKLIGTQCWIKENLKVTKYNNGDPIPDSTSSTWGTAAVGARTGYIISGTPLTSYVGNYGYLYNWYAVSDSRKLCPDGWHVPTDAEWSTLTSYLGAAPADKLRSTLLSNNPIIPGWQISVGCNTQNNSSEFSALPGGYRNNLGSYSINDDVYFWSSTVVNGSHALGRFTDYCVNSFTSAGGIAGGGTGYDKLFGISVRCLKD
jgi:uncharacterized protein (TIGR02145 family)